MEKKPLALGIARKRRGVARASVTRLFDNVSALEAKEKLGQGDRLAIQRLIRKFETLTEEFQSYHYAIVDQVDDEEVLEQEQAIFDDEENRVADLMDRLNQLGSEHLVKPQPLVKEEEEVARPLQGQLRRIERRLRKVQESLSSMELEEEIDQCLLRQLDELTALLQHELADVGKGLSALKKEREDLNDYEATLDKALFDVGLRIKRFQSGSAGLAKTIAQSGVKLPKIKVPTFNGDLMNWGVFWDQFKVAVHAKDHLTDADKLVYLRHALVGGTARHVIEGLSQSAHDYKEAIECLQKGYDRPRLIHRAHVPRHYRHPVLKRR